MVSKIRTPIFTETPCCSLGVRSVVLDLLKWYIFRSLVIDKNKLNKKTPANV